LVPETGHGLREKKEMRPPAKRHRSLCLLCLVLAVACFPAWAARSGEITGVRLDPDGKRLVISCKGTMGKHLARVIGRPNRLVIDFDDTRIGKVPRKMKFRKRIVREIRVGHFKGRARVVADFLNHPVPAFKIKREGDLVSILFGKGLPAGFPAAAATSFGQVPPKAPKPLPLKTKSISEVTNPSRSKGAARSTSSVDDRQAKKKKAAMTGKASPVGKARKDGSKGAPSRGKATLGKDVKPLSALAALSKDKTAPSSSDAKKPPRKATASAASPPSAAKKPLRLKGAKPGRKVALNVPAPANSPKWGKSAKQARSPRPIPDVGSGRDRRMVREVRPPVTPPTPDPRLVVQEITELRFVQVGHNSRLIIRGGDHLDYRMNKVSPTKVRLDLINAEIPKAHQKPLRTDLFSTSVEMIVPGSQTIFVQLKDAVPYQVQKKKGVLMVDFPPPRFAMTDDQRAMVGAEGDEAGKEEYEQRVAALQSRREAGRIMREEEFRRRSETITKQIEVLVKEQEEILKERKEIERKYRVTPDPEIFSKPVTMDFQGISLRNAFRLLAEQAGINIIVGSEVSGTTTMRLFQVPLGQVMDHILKTHNLDRELVGNVMWVGEKGKIGESKTQRNAEYRRLIQQAEGKLARNKKEIRDLEKEREKALQELTKEESAAEELPGELPSFETIGATETIEIEGEPVTLLLVQVRLNYAQAEDIREILQCVFNRECGEATPSAQQAAAETVRAREEELAQQGFQPGSPGAEARLQRTRRELDRERRTSAAEAVAQRTTAAEAIAGLRGAGLDARMAKILAHTVMWANEKYNMLFIKDLPERIEEMKKMISTLDVPTPQVLIESRLVQVERGWSRGLGVQWGGNQNQITQPGVGGGLANRQRGVWGLTGIGTTAARTPAQDGMPVSTGDITSLFAVDLPPTIANVGAMGMAIQFGMIAAQYATNLDLRLQWGEAHGDVKTISRPKVQVLDGETANIKRGRQIAFLTVSADGTQTQLVNVDLLLTVEPKIFPDGRIQMVISISDNSVGDAVNGVASILTREARTTMIVKDGDTAVIGGILRDEQENTRRGWPGLMNMPIINLLFSSKTKRKELAELLVFITPTIVKRPPPAS